MPHVGITCARNDRGRRQFTTLDGKMFIYYPDEGFLKIASGEFRREQKASHHADVSKPRTSVIPSDFRNSKIGFLTHPNSCMLAGVFGIIGTCCI